MTVCCTLGVLGISCCLSRGVVSQRSERNFGSERVSHPDWVDAWMPTTFGFSDDFQSGKVEGGGLRNRLNRFMLYNIRLLKRLKNGHCMHHYVCEWTKTNKSMTLCVTAQLLKRRHPQLLTRPKVCFLFPTSNMPFGIHHHE